MFDFLFVMPSRLNRWTDFDSEDGDKQLFLNQTYFNIIFIVIKSTKYLVTMHIFINVPKKV